MKCKSATKLGRWSDDQIFIIGRHSFWKEGKPTLFFTEGICKLDDRGDRRNPNSFRPRLLPRTPALIGILPPRTKCSFLNSPPTTVPGWFSLPSLPLITALSMGLVLEGLPPLLKLETISSIGRTK